MVQNSLFADTPIVAQIKQELGTDKVKFDGAEYVPKRDDERLSGQILRIFNLMKDGTWRTLDEIHDKTFDPHASISAQLRHLRKKKFGEHIVNRRARGNAIAGLYEYQLIVRS